jgi:hypothetical protein
MVRPIDLHKLIKQIDLVPQAIIRGSIFDLAKRLDFEPIKGHDDLDEFYGVAFLMDDVWPFALMQYRGHPKDKSTIYLPYEINSVEGISKVLNRIISEFELSDRLVWQRSDDVKQSPPTPPLAL